MQRNIERKRREGVNRTVGIRARTRGARETSLHLSFVEPMKASLLESPPKHGRWIYEIKFDGFRALALKQNHEVQIYSRNQKDLGSKFPEVVAAIDSLNVKQAMIDGEIVALDSEGRSSFQLLQGYQMGTDRPPILFYAFDLLFLDGSDLRNFPLSDRKSKLAAILQSSDGLIRYSDSLGTRAEPLLEKVRSIGLEGLIGKQTDSFYESGRRSGSWIKLKCTQEQEFVIGGYTPPSGTRKHFGALLVGFYEKKKLQFAGRVGTGFNAALLRSLHAQFQQRLISQCPFTNLPEKSSARWNQGFTPKEMRSAHWIRPELVCEIKFQEWTRDGKLRHPVFLGLREDKNATEVVQEGSGRDST